MDRERPSPEHPPLEHPPLEHRDVIVIGAGLSGVCAAHHLLKTCPWATWTVLEGRDAIGGTWDLFRYPGVRSDSDMHTLGYPFRPWTGERSIADGDSILQYIRDTAADEGIDRHIRFGVRVVRAEWSSVDARWLVTAETDGRTVQLSCSYLISCTGYYRYDRGHEPEFEGIDEFDGTVVHPQSWPEGLDTAGANVVVIGSGATAITLVPALAATAAHVTMLQRSPSWVVSVPSRTPGVSTIRRVLPARAAAALLRSSNALRAALLFRMSKRHPGLVKRALRRQLQRELPEGFDIDTHFTPDYDPWDQRLCVVADGDLFAALREGQASMATGHIDRFTRDGIRLTDGRELPADVVVTATGLEMLFLGGVELVVDDEVVDVANRLAYRNMLLEGVPNLAMVVGYSNSSWTLRADLTCSWVTRLLDHMRAEAITKCTPVDHGTSTTTEPLMGLRSGYVLRALDRFPKQGSSLPWRSPQSYLRDARDLGHGPLDLDSLELSTVPGGGWSTEPVSAQRARPGHAHPRRPPFTGRVAAITGAGSGIGRALAEALTEQGCHVALADVDETGLAETADRCEGRGVKVSTRVVDVADRQAVLAWAAAVVDEHGGVHLVINNAGVALGATVDAMSFDDAEWLMGVNFWGVVHGTKAFLPHLLAAGDGHIVNVSSVFGLVGVPTQSAYNASKFAVRGFTDALRTELDLADAGVSCTTVHPGGVRTNIARNARVDPSVTELSGPTDDRADRFDAIARTSPAQAAEAILDAVIKNRRRVLIGADARVLDLVSRLPAGLTQRLVVGAARRQAR